MGLFDRNPDSGDDSDTDGTGMLQQRGFVASAIVVVALIICLLVYFLLRGSSDTPTTTPSQTPSTAPTGQPTNEEPTGPPATPATEEPSSTSTPRVTPPPANNSVGGCHAKNPSQTIPRTYAPAAVTWQFDGDMLIPLQVAGGPAATRPNGVKYCFAHSPTGAVLAAMVLLGQVRNRSIMVDVLTDRVLPGPGRTKAIAEAKSAMATPPDGSNVQFAGFKVIDYAPDGSRAIIQIAAQLGDQGIGALPVTMQWSKGDWRAVLQDDGSFNGQVEPDILSSLSGYVRFSGSS